MERKSEERRWFWATLMLSSFTLIAVVFAAWELLENQFFRHLDYVTLHYLYITRGILSSLLLAAWAGWFVIRQRRQSEEELRRSREHYRGLMDASPGAVALFEDDMRVAEWNVTAERLYGFARAEVVGYPLPTIPQERSEEIQNFMREVQGGKPVLDFETLRRNKEGALIEVQLSLLPYQEPGGGSFYLEVTTDIRERVRLRSTLLEIEKLTSMGKMAAGTAHHLNTPLTSMLLRVQMIRERPSLNPSDLERLESSIRFCQHFVQRLLDFGRRAPLQKQPEEPESILNSVIGFLGPSAVLKGLQISTNVSEIKGFRVLADRNLLEALFTILVSNSMEAMTQRGEIRIQGLRPQPDCLEIRVIDEGCGISAADLPRVFDPFFTTKRPGEGTGLGLSIARNIVLEHGGTIHVESSAGGGTTVFVRFPVYASREAARGST